MSKPIEHQSARSKPLLIGLGFTLVALIGFIDFLSGTAIASSIAYLIPISLVSWYLGKRLGVLVAAASSIVWFIANIASMHSNSSPLIHYWNTFARLGIFLIVAYLLSTLKGTLDQLKTALEREKDLARKDSLTPVANERAFYEEVNVEINIARRYGRPFTVGYIHIDNFRVINHSFGLDTGVALLRSVAETIKNNVRAHDKVARLRGDEFAILLPKTGPEAARTVIPKVQAALLNLVHENKWPITFSIGVMTYTSTPNSIDEVIERADALLPDLKRNGQNMIRYEVSSPLQAILPLTVLLAACL